MPDFWIKKMAKNHGMIDPFVEKLVKKNVLSYGLSSYGYDARVSKQFKIFTNVNSATVDPKNFDETSFVYPFKANSSRLKLVLHTNYSNDGRSRN